ncbi:hypothetical protein [Neorhizobium sp. P12A]|uniref:hypothetical protein n=1 Tax=Neorhizobium sp. P12A TaxID=2268027 RepID=UPI0032B1CB1A
MRIDDARYVAAGGQQRDGDGTNGPSSGHAAPPPIELVRAPTLSVDDKRAILAAWASAFYAVELNPRPRQLPGMTEPVSIDEVQAALNELDRRYGI